MTTAPTIQFFSGVNENLSDVSLRRNRSTGAKSVLMTFEQLNAVEKLNSFTRSSSNTIRLVDEEGEIAVTPDSVRLIYGGEEGHDLKGVECQFEIAQEAHWERFLRFMNRYAEANEMEYGDQR